MTETISPPTTALIAMMASGPMMPIEAALQFRFVEFGDPSRKHRQRPVSSPSRSRLLAADEASDSFPPFPGAPDADRVYPEFVWI